MEALTHVGGGVGVGQGQRQEDCLPSALRLSYSASQLSLFLPRRLGPSEIGTFSEALALSSLAVLELAKLYLDNLALNFPNSILKNGIYCNMLMVLWV